MISLRTFIPREILEILDDLDPEIWSLEKCSSTVRIRIAGRVCQSFPLRRAGDQHASFSRNGLAAVRRAVRELV